MPNKKKKKNIGKLPEPSMSSIKIGVLMGKEEVEKQVQRRVSAENSNLLFLSQHYGLEKDDFRSLAMALAREFIEGFEEDGSNSKWDEKILGLLHVEMRRAAEKIGRRGGRFPGTAAARELASDPYWSNFIASDDTGKIAEALRHAFYEAEKENFSKISWNAFLLHQEKNTVDQWDKFVIDVLKNL
jgi:hypothetical protein